MMMFERDAKEEKKVVHEKYAKTSRFKLKMNFANFHS